MFMKKILLSLLVFLGVCGAVTAQTPYKVLKVYKGGEVTHTLTLSDIDSLTVETVDDTPDTPVVPDVDPVPEYVDLGLPSGTLWATTNVGAASPADYGDYFAWGEISPKEDYSWSTYKWCNGSDSTLTKYCTDSSYGTVDSKTVLEAADDAATMNWGSGWRMPTEEEQAELRNSAYCAWTWTTRINSKGETVNGFEIKSEFNGNTIFLPAAGYRSETLLSNTLHFGHYWSSSLCSSTSDSPFLQWFVSTKYDWNHGYRRSCGLSVRPVRASTSN